MRYGENQERGLCVVRCPTCRVYTWALGVGWSEKKLKEKLHYMHRNPVDRKLFLRVYSDHDSVGENPIRTSAPAFLIGALAIDFLAMSDAKDQHDQAVVVDLTDQPVIAHAVFPELPKS